MWPLEAIGQAMCPTYFNIGQGVEINKEFLSIALVGWLFGWPVVLLVCWPEGLVILV